MRYQDTELSGLYDHLWAESLAGFAMGKLEIDPYLMKRADDRRLGMTVLARPSQSVVDQFLAMLDQLAQVEPGQYYYNPDQLHVTVLSLFTATEHFGPYFARLEDYLAVCRRILSAARRFAIDFHGVTASPNVIMGQGFPQDGTLEALRERLRSVLGEQGLGGWLDKRYRIRTAHTTLMRFQRPPQDFPRMVSLLKKYRDFHFGNSVIQALQVVQNDWYMSPEKVKVLAEYPLT